MSCDVFIRFDLIAPDEDTLKRALKWQKAQEANWNKHENKSITPAFLKKQKVKKKNEIVTWKWTLKGKPKKKKKEYVQAVEVYANENGRQTPCTGEEGTLVWMIEQNPDCRIEGDWDANAYDQEFDGCLFIAVEDGVLNTDECGFGGDFW